MIRSNSFVNGFALDTSGAVLVEATLFLPMLLLLALATFEFGRGIEHHHVIVKAMRDAARYLARVPATCPSGSITNATDETTAKNIALTGVPSGGSPRLNYWSDPATISIGVTCYDNTSSTLYGPPYIPLVTVSADVPYADVGVLEILGLGSLTFHVHHEEVNFGE
jgi:Flp pilus assembly protein TadG